MDIVTMAMNLYSQGIDPKLDLRTWRGSSGSQAALTCWHARHPWAGDLLTRPRAVTKTRSASRSRFTASMLPH
jgi:hypothetical protein